MFNNTLFSSGTIDGVNEVAPSVRRLYQAAKELRDVSGQSAVARLLGKSPQVVMNWEARGISSEGALLAQKLIGCDANWLLEGVANIRCDTWVPAANPQFAVHEQIDPKLYNAKANDFWPFKNITKQDVFKLSEYDRGQTEGFIKNLIQAQQVPRKSKAS